jgi:predicted kinase
VSNVNRRQFDEALELAPIAAVEVALSVRDDGAVRGGLLQRCDEFGIALIAHSPLGGPKRSARLAKDEVLVDVAAHHRAMAAQIALAWLLDLSPVVVPIPGARRPETARAAAAAVALELSPEDRAALDPRRPAPSRRPQPTRPGAEVVLVMGIQGAGKSRLARDLVARGYLRLNRDERGGKLRTLAGALDEHLGNGTQRVVLDNTYLTRASRSYVIEVARGRGIPVRCLWLDIPLAQAQVNLVGRLIERFGRLPAPDELRQLSRREPGLLLPTQQMRSLRELEPPSQEEGFAAVERIAFLRSPVADDARGVVLVAASALRGADWKAAVAAGDPSAPHLVFDWNPGGELAALDPLVDAIAPEIAGRPESAHCPHGGGPPSCWCRPPLPGLPLAFTRRHGADPARSLLIGTSPAHRTLATVLAARYVAVP